MERRVGLRGRTDFQVLARSGELGQLCRGIEISPSGIVICRGRPVDRWRDEPLYLQLELRLPERVVPLRALARPVWSFGSHQALRFVRISDVDRLTLAEHLDLLHHRGVPLN
ncbi:MAG: hypothetical protein GX607_08135 [Myxococcales bacterium]|jgi:hypothetical protein|nr:hypothetical protein [Myxococcales bacterium]